jgi:hypothetical protein
MTEPLQPPEIDPADLAASAALDGESPDQTADERRDATSTEVMDEAAVAARIEQFRHVSAAVASGIVVPEPSVRDAHLAAALAAVATGGIESAAGAAGGDENHDPDPVAPPVSLAAHRARPSRRQWVAVAAAVAAVALAVPFVNAIRHRSRTSQTEASSAGPTSTASSTAAAAAAAAGPSSGFSPAAGDAASTTTAPAAAAQGAISSDQSANVAPPVDLGTASSPEELAALVHTAEPQLAVAPHSPTSTQAGTRPSTTVPASPDAAACDAAVRAREPGLGDLALATSATFRGTHVDVLVYVVTTDAGTGYRLLAVTPADCTTVVDILL